MKRNWKKAHPELAGQSFETPEGLVRYDSLGRKVLYRPKSCALCGETFQPTTNTQKYCGSDCRMEGEKVDRICERCEKPFRVPRSSWIRFCSSTCSNRATAEKRKGQKGRFGWGVSQAKPPRKVICPVCRQTFSTSQRTQKYCSTSCRSHGTKDARRKTLGTLPAWSIITKGEKDCRNCGRPAVHLHHVVPRSKSKAGQRDLRNGIPLCFDCHRGWHDRRVIIPVTCLRVPELLLAVELTGPVWVERNYPIPTNLEQVQLVECFGSLLMAYEAMSSRLGEEFMELTAERLPQGELLARYVRKLAARESAVSVEEAA